MKRKGLEKLTCAVAEYTWSIKTLRFKSQHAVIGYERRCTLYFHYVIFPFDIRRSRDRIIIYSLCPVIYMIQT